MSNFKEVYKHLYVNGVLGFVFSFGIWPWSTSQYAQFQHVAPQQNEGNRGVKEQSVYMMNLSLSCLAT